MSSTCLEWRFGPSDYPPPSLGVVMLVERCACRRRVVCLGERVRVDLERDRMTPR